MCGNKKKFTATAKQKNETDYIYLHVVALYISIVYIKCVTASIINTNQLNYVV